MSEENFPEDVKTHLHHFGGTRESMMGKEPKMICLTCGDELSISPYPPFAPYHSKGDVHYNHPAKLVMQQQLPTKPTIMGENLQRREGYSFCARHQQEYLEYCGDCKLGVKPVRHAIQYVDFKKDLSIKLNRCPSSERKQIETLIRRLDWLALRVAQSKYGNLDHDRAEIAALTWAINRLTVDVTSI